MLLLFLLSWTLGIQMANCGHYLLWLPMSSKSVKIAMLDPVYGLASKGHSVTIVCPHRSKKEVAGVTEIINESDLDALSEDITDKQLREKAEMPIFKFIEISITNNQKALETPEVKALLRDEVHIDVVIVAPASGNEAGYYVAYRKNASLVTFMPTPFTLPWISWGVGDIYNPSFMPIMVMGYSNQMSFKERCINTLITMMIKFGLNDLWARPQIESMLRDQFPGEVIPSIHDMSQTVALNINHGSPFLGDGNRPVMPKTILAGLMTCRPAKPLPKDLADFVQGAEHGVIYVSFGSVIKASKMPEEKRQLLLTVFASLQQRIIWKWETPMPDSPPNVMVSSWLPQQDLLAHDKVVLFITHGGAGSVLETICHRTPIVGIPISMDQHINIAGAVRDGLGVVQDWFTLQPGTLHEAVTQVINNPSYGEAVAVLSDRIMDQPQHPLDRVVWWLEYLLRHPHNLGMKNPVTQLSWPQYFLLDVLALFFSILILTGFIIVKIFSYCCIKKQKKD